ncbi:preprotein translocase subunit SecD [Panacagrimonas perspica]|uniref:Protein translocase subunit SecD n=1 Tax=Panacagrimonas perspica TaxID=381431 RepID=A0A4V6Q460_9GAMM|nr:protein translocase subunit SecD [Panacagrimonas perspica]TDU24296.1 preprotein translocase subunit SecD [Panacagrimonas perspica]THD04697.1 protein-export membrane protein SecD [Panacagrimonas perspica]
MRPYATWKYVTLLLVLLLSGLYAAPNLFGEQPAVQISRDSGDPLPSDFGPEVVAALKEASIPMESAAMENGQWVVRFKAEEDQLQANDALKKALGNSYVVALNLAPRTPGWLRQIGAKPMALGLDLRGGVHFLLEVDVDEVRKKAIENYVTEIPAQLRKENIRYSGRRQDGGDVVLDFPDQEKFDAARKFIAGEYRELQLANSPNNALSLRVRITDAEAKRIQDFAVQQNLITLRNRVNQLGVAEPVVQRQGVNRIVVQLPGVQDTTRVKDLLGATATLEYRAVAEDDASLAASSGVAPVGTELYFTREGRRPVLLKKEIIVTGSQIVDAQPTVDENHQPAVSVTLDGQGAKKMFEFTTNSVGKPMAVLFRERQVTTTYNAKGEPVREHRDVQEIISVASIRGVFGKRFQTTGLESKEAHDLALLIKAGALAAPVDIVEERTVGPSLGADNIRRGFQAAMLGLAMVAAFMVFYYRVFGVFAIMALTLNLLILVAGLSIMQATLSMPGIAGIVLTMGIAVDANVLIYERIREELRNGMKPHAAIEAGYDRAFLTIADANVTTLVATVVLFVFGSGPVKGFAVTLTLGILASQFTAIVGSRALSHLVFARRSRMTDLPIW